ncbi:MAG TPA: glutamine--tRNA ligase/YqeY domain fusion protein [Phycisphaerales bacterium]|nr:glutamine--tRNA ligase/YqeY domain fusion protein [Phycisphaerales bacterium]
MSDRPRHFIQQIIDEDNRTGRWGGRVHTRFPPEPNGYLHIGHAMSICLNFGLAKEFGGRFNLRFDDTNPVKEETEYVESIKRDVKWLGGDWEGPNGGGLYFASNYFQQMHDFAVELIRKGRAYVCDLTPDEMRDYRGTLTEPGRPSPYRDRTAEENLDLFERMAAGEFPDGSRTLRARIDMASPNINLRDPVMYRVLHATHHNTGDRWSIYPMYDWAHGIEDSLEGITHSICTLEFEDHRPLYDWYIDAINEGRTGDGSGPWGGRIHHPQQIEFAKFLLNYVVLSKRNLIRLVKEGRVRGWDDPRMMTISGLRRRGVTPEALRSLCHEVGVTKFNSVRDMVLLENAVREHLNRVAPRRMAVLRPLRVVIENYPEGKAEEFEVANNPEDGAAGTRRVAFSRELYIEREDFLEDPPKKFFRLAPGREVRLRGAYWIRCERAVKDAAGAVVELRCTYDPQTRGGESPPPDAGGEVRKVKGTLHWVSAAHAIEAEVRLVDRLFTAESPGRATGNFLDDLNPGSLEVVKGARLEPALAERTADEPEWADGIRRFQFERLGYFCVDADSRPGALVFNRTMTLKDSWAKQAGRE